jgi:plastocyanin
MRKETRDRLVLPILVPVGSLAVIVAVLWGFSRILLSVTANAATGTAFLVSLSIVVLAGIAASRPQVRFSAVAAMAGAVAGVAMLAGGIALIAFAPKSEGAGPQGPAVTVALVAKDIQFDPTKLSVPAGAPFAIAFDNQDATIQHDVQIFDNPDRTGTPLFDGALLTGVGKTTYHVGALDAGTYYFHCVVHPTMIGTIEAAGGGGQSPGPSEGVTVVAQGLQFDTSEIDLPADTPTTITFTNNDAGQQHDIAIFQDDSLAKVLFRGDLVTGVATVEYDVSALPEGTYYFHCDVHPTMNGSVVVKAAPSGGGAPGPSPSGTPGASPPGGGGPPPSGSVSITASGLQFDKASFSLPAAGGTIAFTNNDAGQQHNIAIYTDSSGADNLFRGDFVTGVDTVEYQVPAIPPGTYYFQCDVHPTMNGSVTIA